jgi:hypothetical protein
MLAGLLGQIVYVVALVAFLAVFVYLRSRSRELQRMEEEQEYLEGLRRIWESEE